MHAISWRFRGSGFRAKEKDATGGKDCKLRFHRAVPARNFGYMIGIGREVERFLGLARSAVSEQA